MPHSATNKPGGEAAQEGSSLAVKAEILYLLNLLIFPGLAFAVLGFLYVKYRHHPASLVRCHLKQTFFVSLWAGVMIVLMNIIILSIGGYKQPATWVIAILYFTSVHAGFVLLGAIGLARAISQQHYHFFLIGPECTFGDT